MRRIILIGRVGAGKTTLLQALHGECPHYAKTQAISFNDYIIDTPGEYIETKHFGAALALYAYEADVVGLLASADEPFSLFSPNITCMVNREVVGIITGGDRAGADIERVRGWLYEAGCRRFFIVNSFTGEGIDDLLAYLDEQPSGTEKPDTKQAKVSITQKYPCSRSKADKAADQRQIKQQIKSR